MTDLPESDALDEYDAPRDFVRQAFVTGSAVMLPVVVTLIVLGVVVNFISKQLDPVVALFASATGIDPASETALKFAAMLALFLLIFFVGVLTEYRSDRSEFAAIFDTLLSRIPGIGSLYRSLDEMSTLLLDNDTDSFREVKLVEFPVAGSYALAFLTADTPDVVRDATDSEEMVTLFLPMAPNPVMGGYVLHVSEDRVFDVDLSVEEGVQSIVTSGVATGRETRDELPEDMIDRLNRRLAATDTVVSFADLERYASDASSRLEETARETIAGSPPRSGADSEDERSGADSEDERSGADRGD